MKDVVDEVIKAYGGIEMVMTAHNYKDPQGVYNWRYRGIPISKLQKINQDTGIPFDTLLAARETTAA